MLRLGRYGAEFKDLEKSSIKMEWDPFDPTSAACLHGRHTPCARGSLRSSAPRWSTQPRRFCSMLASIAETARLSACASTRALEKEHDEHHNKYDAEFKDREKSCVHKNGVGVNV